MKSYLGIHFGIVSGIHFGIVSPASILLSLMLNLRTICGALATWLPHLATENAQLPPPLKQARHRRAWQSSRAYLPGASHRSGAADAASPPAAATATARSGTPCVPWTRPAAMHPMGSISGAAGKSRWSAAGTNAGHSGVAGRYTSPA